PRPGSRRRTSPRRSPGTRAGARADPAFWARGERHHFPPRLVQGALVAHLHPDVAEDFGEVEPPTRRHQLGMVDPEVILDDCDLGVARALGGRDAGVAVEAVEEVAHRHRPRTPSGARAPITSPIPSRGVMSPIPRDSSLVDAGMCGRWAPAGWVSAKTGATAIAGAASSRLSPPRPPPFYPPPKPPPRPLYASHPPPPHPPP